MKKTTIFLTIGLILVAILTGCQDKVSYPPYPSAVFIEQTEDFLEGQSFNSENFKVVVRYFDGSETEYPNAGLKLSGKGGIVNSGDTVSISVGTDVNGREVKNEITLDVYKLGNVTAETKKESYTVGETPKAEDLTVTAHYEGNKTLVLKATDYTVTKVAINDGADDPTKETVPGHFTVTVSSAIAAAGTPGSTYEVPVTVAQTAITGNIETVEGIVDYTGVDGKATTFQIPALNYEGKDELPEPDASKIYVKVTTDATAEGEYDYVLASAIEGLELSYVDPTTKIALDDKWNTYDFASVTANNNTGVAIVATWNEKTTEPLTVQAAETSIKVEYCGTGLTTGTANKDINVSDFRVYLIANGESALVEGLKATDFVFAKYSTGSNETANAISNEYYYATVNYKGIPVSKTTGAKVDVLKAIPVYTITEAQFVDSNKTGIVYKQKYNAGQMPVAAVKNDLSLATISDGTNYKTVSSTINAEEWERISVGGYYVTDKNGEYVPLTAGYDFSAKDAKAYLAVTYTPETGKATTCYAEVTLTEPTVTSVTLSVAYDKMYGSTAQPMLDSPIKFIVTGNTATGTVDLSEDTTNVSYYVNGETGSSVSKPAKLSSTALGAEVGVVYNTNIYSNTVVIEDQPHGYFTPVDGFSGEKFVLNSDSKFYIGSKISFEEGDYAIAEGAFEYKKGYEAETVPTAASDVPHITDVSGNPFVPVAEADNKVNVNVAYLDSTGKMATQNSEVFTFNGKAWATETSANSLTVTLDGIELTSSRDSESARVSVEAKSYNTTDIVVGGLTEKGSNAYSVDVLVDGVSIGEADTFTVNAWAKNITIVVEWTDNKGSETKANFFIGNF